MALHGDNIIKGIFDCFKGILTPCVSKIGIILLENEEVLTKFKKEHLTPDEQSILTDGSFIYKDIPQIIFADSDYATVADSLTYLLTSSTLMLFDFPRWIMEALNNYYLSKNVYPQLGYTLDENLVLADREAAVSHFKKTGLKDLWSGEVFNQTTRDHELACELSYMFFNSILQENKSKVQKFLEDCNYEDSGNASLLKHFNFDLKDLSDTYLQN